MFQKLTLYRAGNLPASIDALAHYLASVEFTPTHATQAHSAGFVPPRGPGEAFAEAIAGHWIGRAMIERRSVPGSALQKRVDEQVEQIEQATGRKPGRKECRALKEDALIALLPQAFPKQVAVPIWIDRDTGLLVIGSTSQAVIDDVFALLIRAVPDITVAPLNTKLPARWLMARWLTEGDADGDFSLGDECELKADDETGAAVRYSRHSLHDQAIAEKIAQRMMPARLALEWFGRVSFRLSAAGSIDKLKLLDLVFADRDDEEADRFDADVAIWCGELKTLIGDLVEVLGGEAVEGGAA